MVFFPDVVHIREVYSVLQSDLIFQNIGHFNPANESFEYLAGKRDKWDRRSDLGGVVLKNTFMESKPFTYFINGNYVWQFLFKAVWTLQRVIPVKLVIRVKMGLNLDNNYLPMWLINSEIPEVCS